MKYLPRRKSKKISYKLKININITLFEIILIIQFFQCIILFLIFTDTINTQKFFIILHIRFKPYNYFAIISIKDSSFQISSRSLQPRWITFFPLLDFSILNHLHPKDRNHTGGNGNLFVLAIETRDISIRLVEWQAVKARRWEGVGSQDPWKNNAATYEGPAPPTFRLCVSSSR